MLEYLFLIGKKIVLSLIDTEIIKSADYESLSPSFKIL